MRASPLQGHGLAIAVTGAGSLVLWLLAELALKAGTDTTPTPITYIGLALLLTTGIAIGFMARAPQWRRERGRLGDQTHEIVESLPGIAWTADADGQLTGTNASFRNYLHATAMGASPHREVVHPEDYEQAVNLWKRCLETGEEFQSTHRARGRDGAYRWFRAVARARYDPLGRVIGWCGTLIDIDDQKVAEETARAREASLESILDNIPGIIATADSQGNHTYANRKGRDYFRVDQSELGGPRWLDIVHPEDRDGVAAAWSRAVQTSQPMDDNHRLRRFDGTCRWFHARVEPALDEDGRVLRWYGLITDIDDRKRAEDALRARERELQRLVDTMPTLVWCAAPDGEPSYNNKACQDYSGVKMDELEASDGSKLRALVQAIVHPDDAAAFRRNLTHAFTKGQSFAMRYRRRRVDGAYRWVDARAEPLRDDDGSIVQWYGVCTDIDDETRVQEALRAAQDSLARASHLAGLAELSASIAHEVNQPLAAVIANSQACQRWLSADPPNTQRASLTAERIVRDAMGAAEVVGRIRALFAQRASTRASIDINETIGEVHRLMSDEIASAGILLETSLDRALPLARADRAQMQQVLVNLIRNGIDAVRANVGVQKSLVIGSGLDGEGKIRVDVRDNGCGVVEPGRIFEPFFTTKHEGMGMGLAICRSILASHDGALWVESIAPRGTSFSFTLPCRQNGRQGGTP